MTAVAISLVTTVVLISDGWGQSPPASSPNGDQSDRGSIPVDNDELVEQCGSCHAVDDQGRMSRISFMRKTPEGWQRSLLRMVSLQGVDLEPDAARRIVRYLSNQHGLAPEELRPAFWEVERRVVPNEAPNAIIRETCTACHSVGRILTQRRTPEEWRLLTETHRGYYPLIDNQVYRQVDDDPEDLLPVEEALAYLADALPLTSTDWAEWSASARPPRLAGTWLLKGWEIGRGPVFGTVEIESVPGSGDQFRSRADYAYAKDGARVRREGELLVYTGYQWRGRSRQVESSGDQPQIAAGGELREVMLVEPDWREASGRWYTGAYDELGLDVTLTRVGSDPALSGVYPESIQRGSSATTVSIHGANLPSNPDLADLDFGPGVQIMELLEADSQVLSVRVSADADTPVGVRDLHLGHVTLPEAIVIFDRVARIEVRPQLGMARVGGENLPKQYERFEAIGFGAGLDAEAGTEDDLRLGLTDVSWSLEEYPVGFGDDDVRFVGSIDDGGRFTPAADGPNPARPGDRNNIGEVWATARYTPRAGASDVLEARGQLVVTVPLYLRWELYSPPEDLGADR